MKKQYSITKISNNLFYALLAMITLAGCIKPKIISPLVVSGIEVNEAQNMYPFKYMVTFKGYDNDALFFTDVKYNVGDTLR